MRRYIRYWLRLAKTAASGTIRGSLNWGPIIGAAIFGAALSIGNQTEMPALLANGWQGVVLTALVFSSIAWMFFFVTRIVFVAPYSLLKGVEGRLATIEE